MYDTVISQFREEIAKVKCCDRVMRNLTEEQYINEKSINDSGARDLNQYRGN